MARRPANSELEAALSALVGALEPVDVSARLLAAALRISGLRAGEVVVRAADGAEHSSALRGSARARESLPAWSLALREQGQVLGELRLYGTRPRSAARRRDLVRLAAAGARALAAAQTHAGVLRRAELDPLTGLANRGRMWEMLEYEVTRAERYGRVLSFVMFDIDGLKRVNDGHGHLAGDEALVGAARLMRERSRASDTAARFGGDEFALVLPETPLAGALAVAEKIRASVEELGAVTISAGVASAPDDGRTAARLLGTADARLYAAKAAGGNRVSVVS
jgi:diguanylate cyclase (GGDEF)-like protein